MALNYPGHHIDPPNKLPHNSIPPATALEELRPKTRADRMQLLAILAYVVFAIAFVASLVYLKHRAQQSREETWVTAAATIEDTRTQLAGVYNSIYGGGLSYEVDVLAKFSVDGASREEWITLSQAPKGLDSARYQAQVLKGKQCYVRWNPSHPKQTVAEIN
jgi:Protein of unknown function (DUF3592)